MAKPTLTLTDLDAVLRQAVGQKMVSLSVASDAVKKILDITKSHLFDLRSDGALSPIPVHDPERNIVAQAWNAFVAGDDLLPRLDRPLTVTISRYIQFLTHQIAEGEGSSLDPYQILITENLIAPLAEEIRAEIREGFPLIEQQKNSLFGSHPSAWDTRLDEECLVTFTGWQPKFWRADRGYDDFIPVDLNAQEPCLVHFTIPAGEPIWFVGSRTGPEIIKDALYAAHVEKMKLPYRFNGDVGKLEHSRMTQEQTGVMSIYMGDYFPHVVREIATGRAYLVAFGQTNAPEEAEGIKADCPEDWETGYFLIEDPRFDMSSETTIEKFSIATQTDLLNLVAAESGESVETILGLMEKDLASRYPELVRLDPFHEEVHVYIPYGAAVNMSHAAFCAAGHYPFTGGHDCSVIVSPTPLEFPVGVVEELGVSSPRQRAEMPVLPT